MATSILGEQSAESIAHPFPIVARRREPLAGIVDAMLRGGVTHVPVCEGGEIQGLLSRASVSAFAALWGQDLDHLTAEQAMFEPPGSVPHDTPVPELVRRVLGEDSEAVLVRRDHELIGVVTAKDLLSLVSAGMDDRPGGDAPRPSRRDTLVQHDRLRGMLDHLEEIACRLANGEQHLRSALVLSSRVVTSALLAHLAAEEGRLVPVLRRADGAHGARADELLGEHDRQRSLLARLHRDLAQDRDGRLAAVRALELVRVVRDDMAFEEHEYVTGTDEGF